MTVKKLNIPSEKWCSLSHYERRLLCSKHRRSLKRQKRTREKEAQEKEEEQRLQANQGYCDWLKNKELQEEEKARKEELLRQYNHELWLKREAEAQKKFEKQRELEEKVKADREERERRIREEWEAMEKKEREDSEKKKKLKEAKEALLHDATTDDASNEEPWHNPLAPPDAPDAIGVDYGTEKDSRNCSFYLKTGACRFGERCSKFHPVCQESTTLLVPNMFASLGFMEMMLDERDNDVSLEYEEGELYENFRDFYNDVWPEFSKAGRIVQFKVCCNHELHLRGNVYVQYAREEECLTALNMFNGRWYAQRQLSCELCHVTKWKSAICGLFGQNRCPKGRHCNFLHVFRNPGGAYARADLDMPPYSPSRSHRRSSLQRNSYNSQRRDSYHDRGYQRSYRSRSRSRERRSRRIKSRSRSRSKSGSRERRTRSKSRSQSRKPRSKERRRKSRSKSRSRSRRRRSRSRGRIRLKSPNRSKNSRKKIRSRSRSQSRSRSSSRKSRNREKRPKSRSKSKSKSRSQSRERRSRSKSVPRSIIRRSRSRSKSKSRSRSRSRENNKPEKAIESHDHVQDNGNQEQDTGTLHNGSVSTEKVEAVVDNSSSSVAVDNSGPPAAAADDPVVKETGEGPVAIEENGTPVDSTKEHKKKKQKKHKKHKHKKHKVATEV